MQPQTNKPFFEMLPSKTAFFLGFVSAILALGTLGFLVLGSCMLGGDCEAFGASGGGNDAAAAPSPTQPTAAAPQPNQPAPSGTPAEVTDEDHIRGDVNAPLTLIEYSDFECPFCQRFHPTAQKVLDEYDGQVRWVYRHFPLSFHPNAQKAAEAAECAGDQGKFWEYGDQLFANQDSLGQATYERLAGELGLDAGQFGDCLSSGKYTSKVQAQSTEGASAGVSGTPGSFIVDEDGNVQEIRGAVPYEQVKATIDAML